LAPAYSALCRGEASAAGSGASFCLFFINLRGLARWRSLATILNFEKLESVMGTRQRDALTHGIEHELTLHLERASDLSQRAKRANNAAQHEIERALEIADELRDVSSESESRAGALRRLGRGR